MNQFESLVDPQWELLDPTPDVRALFVQFDDIFFEGKLAGCEVKWSTRMTLCAGMCCYEGRGGLCSIRLSKPLLTFRSRKDLVETLLHEMIHAYLFVTVRDRDRDGHGAQFQYHMRRINAVAGTNITIYHSFHAEVANYRQHWWRCDGPCRNRRPFYGFVKRATNRAPGSNDYWWMRHQATCGGKFVKVKEPEGYVHGKRENVGLKQKMRPASSGVDAKDVCPSKTGQRTITDFFTGSGYVLGGNKPSHPFTGHGTSPTVAAALRRQKENLSKAAALSGDPKSASSKVSVN
uniref:SprT-like domain-containing protein n=1 Tax=Parascaris univalens TaxID=6257 RepID=A0A915AUI1_PARUN